MAQWIRVCLLMKGTQVRSLVWEDPTCREATKPSRPQLLKPAHARAGAPQQRGDPLAATRESTCTEVKTQHGQE